jgi:hypothetical protein
MSGICLRSSLVVLVANFFLQDSEAAFSLVWFWIKYTEVAGTTANAQDFH